MKRWMFIFIITAIAAGVTMFTVAMYFEQRDTRDLVIYWQGRADGRKECKQQAGFILPNGVTELKREWQTDESL